MKDTIIALLQQRMDKCTNEQFWAVASLTAADGFVVASHKDIAERTPSWLVLGAITIATVYGVWFVIQRHFAYYRNRQAMASLLAHEQNIPEFLKHKPNLWSSNSLSGVVFYIGWILAGCILCYFVTSEPVTALEPATSTRSVSKAPNNVTNVGVVTNQGVNRK